MLKTLASYVKEFKRDSILTPICMLLEVAAEMVIPLLMASIIDKGVDMGDMAHITKTGAVMLVIALFGLAAGLLGGKYGARASAGFARNLRQGMYENIQTFSFSNIDDFTTGSLITRLTNDVTQIQNFCGTLLRGMFRSPVMLIGALIMSFANRTSPKLSFSGSD